MNIALNDLYRIRFGGEHELEKKTLIWQEICAYLQRFIPRDGKIVDIACGYGEFINNIDSVEKIGIDINPDVGKFLSPEVNFLNINIFDAEMHIERNWADVIFISNFFEHLDDPGQILRVLNICRSILKPRGKIIILQPNIKYVGYAYWDFLDHKIALTEKSLLEAAGMCALHPVHMILRFLPFTTKSALPQFPFLVRWYLRCLPVSGLLLGGQTLLVLEGEN